MVPVRRPWMLVPLALLVGAIIAGCSVRSPVVLSYWIVDDRTLGVQAMEGPNEACAVASTLETTTEVRVRVECAKPILSAGSTGAGYLYKFVIPLAMPLADRAVIDGTGMPASRCVTSPC